MTNFNNLARMSFPFIQHLNWFIGFQTVVGGINTLLIGFHKP